MFRLVEKTAIISVPKCNALLFILEAPSVLCEIRTESLYIKLLIFVFIAVCDAMNGHLTRKEQ